MEARTISEPVGIEPPQSDSLLIQAFKAMERDDYKGIYELLHRFMGDPSFLTSPEHRDQACGFLLLGAVAQELLAAGPQEETKRRGSRRRAVEFYKEGLRVQAEGLGYSCHGFAVNAVTAYIEMRVMPITIKWVRFLSDLKTWKVKFLTKVELAGANDGDKLQLPEETREKLQAAKKTFGMSILWDVLGVNENCLEEATKTIEVLDELGIESGASLLVRGTAYEKGNDLSHALVDLFRCLKTWPSCYLASNEVGVVFRKTKKIQQAFQFFSTAIELNETFLPARYNRAVLYFEQKQYPDALVSLNYLIKIRPSFADPYLLAAKCYEAQSELLKAADCLHSYTMLKPESPTGYLRYGTLAWYLAQEASSLAGNDALVFHMRWLLVAKENYTQLIRLLPRDPYGYWVRSVVNGELGCNFETISDLSAHVRLSKAKKPRQIPLPPRPNFSRPHEQRRCVTPPPRFARH